MRERVQPKMGKVDINYQKLHNAFFKFQTKLTAFGFDEGKNSKHHCKRKGGGLSPELVEVLSLSIPPLTVRKCLTSSHCRRAVLEAVEMSELRSLYHMHVVPEKQINVRE